MSRIAIVGAGIIGATLAYRLAQGGHDIVVIDQAGVASGASGTSFGWLNASFHHDEAHFRLRAQGLKAWKELGRKVELPINWCGALWWEEQGAGLERMAQKLAMLEYPVSHLTQTEARALEPELVGIPDEVLRFPSEGVIELDSAARKLLRASGARCLFGTPVQGVSEANGRVTGVITPQGKILSDQVIVASGNGAPKLLETLGIPLPMLSRPGLLMRTKPLSKKVDQVLVTPDQEVRQLPDGRLLAPTSASHQSDNTEEITESMEKLAAAAASRVGKLLGEPGLGWSEVALAYRPVPEDGLPVIGAAGPKGLYVAVMHSGATLAAVAADLLADEMEGEGRSPLLAPYTVERFSLSE